MKIVSVLASTALCASCMSPGFEDRTCNDVTEYRDDGLFDEAPSWPVAEDAAPAAGGPTLTFAMYEFLDDTCPTARLTIEGRLGTGALTEDAVRESLRFHVSTEGARFPFSDLPTVQIAGDTFTVVAHFCGAYWDYARPGAAAWVHLADDAGVGSNAQCVFVSAAPGVPVPDGTSKI